MRVKVCMRVGMKVWGYDVEVGSVCMRRVEEGRLTSLNLSSSSMKATMIARERATACLTLSALSSISICFSIESTREPRSSALGGEEGRRRVEEKGGGGRRRGRGRMEGKNGGKEGMHMWG